MKIFVVYAKVELTQKPSWLDAFRIKYDKPYEYHITLKQPCVIEEDQVNDIKNKLNNLFSNLKIPNQAISLTFDSLNIPEHTSDICIMIKATNTDQIDKLQHDVVSTLFEYNQYLKTEYKQYEENFEPHITIARNLDETSYSLAAKELEQDYICQGFVNEIVLAVVENPIASEVNDPKNQTVFLLS